MVSRRRSRTRCVRRTVSERFSSSSWKGGVSEGLRISIACASTSTSPLAIFGLVVPSGRRRTTPVTFRTNSLRMRSAVAKVSLRSGSDTTCASPSRSRRSMKITPPWSRRRGAEHHRIEKRQGAAQGHGEPDHRQNRDARCCKAPERSERSEKTHRQGERGALLAIGSGFRLTEKQRVVEADAENEQKRNQMEQRQTDPEQPEAGHRHRNRRVHGQHDPQRLAHAAQPEAEQ